MDPRGHRPARRAPRLRLPAARPDHHRVPGVLRPFHPPPAKVREQHEQQLFALPGNLQDTASGGRPRGRHGRLKRQQGSPGREILADLRVLPEPRCQITPTRRMPARSHIPAQQARPGPFTHRDPSQNSRKSPNGMPPHIAQLIVGHRDINTTMGYKAVYPEEAISGHRAFIARRRALRPARNTAPPPTPNGKNSSATSNAATSRSATAAAPTDTSCIHEHSCLTEMILVTYPDRCGCGESWCSPMVTGKNLGLPRLPACRRGWRRPFSPGRRGSARRSCGAARAFHRV